MVCNNWHNNMAYRGAERTASVASFGQASDGVPVTLSGRLVPPPMISLPKNFQIGNPSEVLFMEYDFNLEERVLKNAEIQRQHKEALAARAETARLAAEVAKEEEDSESSAAATETPDDEETTPTSAEQVLLQPRDVQSLFLDLGAGSILTPTPITNPQPRGSKTPTRTPGSTFNIADFENEQDPFDNLELKTLDDMEELNKVLQGAQTTAVVDNPQSQTTKTQVKMPNGHTVQTVQTQAYKNLKDVDYPDIDSLHLSHTRSQQSPPSGPFYGQGSSQTNVYSQHNNTGSYYLNSNYTNNGYVQNVSDSRNTFTKSPPLPPVQSGSGQYTRNGASHIGMPTHSSYNKGVVDLNPFSSSVHYTPNGFVSGAPVNELNPLRSTKSTPDITKLDDKLSHRMLPTSHTPPPYQLGSSSRPGSRPSSRPSTPPPRPSTQQTWNKHSILPPMPQRLSNAETSNESSTAQLPDPYNSLSHEAQRLVNTISDMGFRRARVARAVHQLGQDERKVLDHLCAVNRIHEKEFPLDDAETALHHFDQNEEKAVQYLKLLGQFKELGFAIDKIRDALISADLNENKALDLLTST